MLVPPAEVDAMSSAEAHYYQEANPARALAMLEEDVSSDDIAKLRDLLEKEVEAQVPLLLHSFTPMSRVAC